MANEVIKEDCKTYRIGDVKTADLTVFSSLEDYALPKPQKTTKIMYGKEYLKTPHIPGRPGFPYETNMTFHFEKDTGLPVASQTGNDMQIEVSVRATWVSAEEELRSVAFIPDNLNFFTYLGGDLLKGSMQRVEFITGRPGNEVTRAELQFNEKNEIYAQVKDGQVKSYMICHKNGAYPVPHCTLRLKVSLLTAEVRFQKDLLEDFEDVHAQASNFIMCLMQE